MTCRRPETESSSDKSAFGVFVTAFATIAVSSATSPTEDPLGEVLGNLPCRITLEIDVIFVSAGHARRLNDKDPLSISPVFAKSLNPLNTQGHPLPRTMHLR